MLSYAFYINKQRVYGVDIGFSTNDNWEEALDDVSFTLPAEKLSTPHKMLSLVEIIINDGTETKTREYILIDDHVTEISKYGYYKHDIYAIEYTDKLNKYLISGFASSKWIKRKHKATTYINSSANLHGNGAFTSATPFQRQTGDNLPFAVYVYSKTLDIMREYNDNEKIVIPKLEQAYQATRWTTNYAFETTSKMVRSDLFITSSLFNDRKQISGSLAPLETVIELSNYEGLNWIEFEVYAHDRLDNEDQPIDDEYVVLYRYEFQVIKQSAISIYDVLMRVSNLVSKLGGIERSDLFYSTRVFDISNEVAEYLKKIEAPEIYLEKATALQTINFILTYVNGIARLNHAETLDSLTVDFFNKSAGNFNMEEAVSYGSKQSADQLGTQGISFFEQALPTDMNEPNIAIPNDDWYKTVRATDLQLTDTTFELKLDESRKLYTPNKLKVRVPEFKFNFVLPNPPPDITFEDTWVDLTDVWINVDEWNLKFVSDNFPNAYTHRPFNNSVFEKPYKIDNLFWQRGDTSVKLSNVYGVDFKSQHIKSVIERACLEYAMTHLETPVVDHTHEGEDYYAVVFNNFTVNLGGGDWWRDLRFYVEYVSDNSLVAKHDKEDLEEINFYSEMKINQDENIINLSRGSRKAYGDLQRTSNKQLSFQRVHYKLSEQFAMGTTDINDLTVTNVETEWHNYFFISKYTLTKHFNRIGQATFIDQAYRPFNAYNKDIMKRHDNYKDYLMVTPPNILVDNYIGTLIHNKAIEIILETLLGRKNSNTEKTKASTLLLRTDGTLWQYPDQLGAYRNYVTTPLSSSGVKGGFIFDFSFVHNMVVGDLSTQDENATNTNAWYNRAVRYTDDFGRLEKLDFIMLNGEILQFDSEDYAMKQYPLITLHPQKVTMITPKMYFGMTSLPEELSAKSLVVQKDTRTNYGLSYQVSVQSKYFGMYIFGQLFFSKNFIVTNVSDFMNQTMFLYLYTENPNYKIFEDLLVKDGYETTIEITETNLIITPTNIQNGYAVRFQENIGIDLYEGWAIGDSEGNLYVAHNGNNNGFDIIPTHFRDNVYEIGRGDFSLNHVIRVNTNSIVQIDIDSDNNTGLLLEIKQTATPLLNVVKSERHNTSIVFDILVTEETSVGNFIDILQTPIAEVSSVLSEKHQTNVVVGVQVVSQDMVGDGIVISIFPDTYYNDGINQLYFLALNFDVGIQSEEVVGEVVNSLLSFATIQNLGFSIPISVLNVLMLQLEVDSETVYGETVELGLGLINDFDFVYGDGFNTTVNLSFNVIEETVGESIGVSTNLTTLVTTSLIRNTTTNPTLQLNCFNGILTAIVTNKDVDDSTITLSNGINATFRNVPYNENRTEVASGLTGLITVRARAKAIGKLQSNLVSSTYNMMFCLIVD